MSSPPMPVLPDFGDSQLNLPDILDFHLDYNPDPSHPLFVFAEPGSTQTTEIKALEYVRAAHRVAHAVRRDSQPGDSVAIIANIDTLVYSALITGIIKAGLVPFAISPRNSPTALLHLIRKSSTHRVLMTQTTLRGVVDGLKAELQSVDPLYELSIEEVPTLQYVFPYLGRETAADPFTAFSTTFSPKDSDKGIYFHSSGSTGLPKPILLTHQIIKDDTALLCIPKFRESFAKLPLMGTLSLPSFHVMGFLYQVLFPLYGPFTTVVFAPTVTKPEAVPILATPESVIEACKIIKPSFIRAVPTFFNIWNQSDEAVEFLRTLRALSYAGGPLAPQIAESLISKGVAVTAGYGGTEFGEVTELRLDSPDTWQYMEFREGVNIRWIAQGDGTYEAQYLASKRHHLAVENLPDVSGYASSDLWKPHPTIPKLWKIVGRIDDVLIHSSGEKTVPAPMEEIITASPMLSGCIMFGRQRDQPGILLELRTTYQIDVQNSTEVSNFRNMIWPVIEEANKIAPSFSRIFKEMVLIVHPDRPLPRVGKDTLARKAALSLYEAEINQLYETIESNSGGDSIEPPENWEAQKVEPWLEDQISIVLSAETPTPSSDLFEHGLDSLSATILRLRIVSALRKSGFPAPAAAINQNLVYRNPTIVQLTQTITKLVKGEEAGADTSHADHIEKMISKYSQGVDVPVSQPVAEIDPQQQCVLLTGSTGNIGAQLLESLLRNGSVARVYALNRLSNNASMLDRHRARFQDKALDVSVLSSPKLVFLSGETSQEDLGLPKDTLNELHQNLTMIIHNAWKLDFNLSLSSFESHVKGSRNLMDLARSSHHSSSIRFLFTSSIASTQSWDAQKLGPYPEEIVMDAKYAVGGGYGESKYVTDRILAASGLRATSFRIGQVAGGAPNGAWATTDWVPIIVKSSLSINMLPDAVGVVSWVPMDAVCQAILDIGLSTESAPTAVNIVHPTPVSWTSVIQHIRSALIQEKNLPSDALPLVPYHEWMNTIEQHASDMSETKQQNIPAVKLVEFFRIQANSDSALRKSAQSTTESVGLTPMSTANVEKLSESMKLLAPLDSTLANKWVKYWINAGI